MQNRHEGPDAGRPPADREVPLPGMIAADGAVSAVHQWLDGEGPEASARLADARQVDFWQRVHVDVARHRATKAPPQLLANVMAAIPVREPSVVAPRVDAKPVVRPEDRASL